MTRPPPTSTLFPYPPLSRSLGGIGVDRHEARGGRCEQTVREGEWHRPEIELQPRRGPGDHGDAPRHSEQPGDEQDRKSTRLNSSHLVISYAVFCLKKKKTHP